LPFHKLRAVKKVHPIHLAPLAATLVAAAFAAPALAADDAAPIVKRIGTMTRGARVFGDAEDALVAALKSQDAAALERLVAPDFEQRTQGAPGTPVPREDWIKRGPGEVAHATGLRDIAVHDYGDINVVSFTWTREPPQASAFVVDVWQRKPGGGDAWQLSTRYQSTVPAGVPKRGAKPASAPASVDPKR
jgi:hypothetical protein